MIDKAKAANAFALMVKHRMLIEFSDDDHEVRADTHSGHHYTETIDDGNIAQACYLAITRLADVVDANAITSQELSSIASSIKEDMNNFFCPSRKMGDKTAMEIFTGERSKLETITDAVTEETQNGCSAAEAQSFLPLHENMRVREASTLNEMRVEIYRLMNFDHLIFNVMRDANYIGLSPVDTYTLLAYHALANRDKLRELVMQHAATSIHAVIVKQQDHNDGT